MAISYKSMFTQELILSFFVSGAHAVIIGCFVEVLKSISNLKDD